jgi:hypothetical protein
MVSIFMAIIVLYFNYRTLKLNEKDREQPRVVELVQFVILPVKAWLSDIGRYDLERALNLYLYLCFRDDA